MLLSVIASRHRSTSSGPWLTGWSKRRLLTIDHTKVGNGTDTLTDFPVLVSLSGLSGILTNGADIRFTTSDGQTELPREIESYSSGTLVSWVKVSSLSHTADTQIYMYYGNSGATEPAANAVNGSQAVWGSDFKAVWHLKEATGTNIADSTSNGNTGTPSSSPTQVAGKIDGALDFNRANSQYVNVGTASAVNLTGAMSVSLWFKANGDYTSHQFMVGNATSNGASSNFGFNFGYTDNKLTLWNNGANVAITSSASISDNNWRHLVATRSGTTSNWALKIYINGALDNSGSSAQNPSGATNNTTTIGKWGAYTGAQPGYITGTIEEVRLSTAVQTLGWISTEYQNQNSPGDIGSASFYTVGNEESGS